MSDHAADPQSAPQIVQPTPHSTEALDPFEGYRLALLKSIFESPGDLDPLVRQAIFARTADIQAPDTFHPDSIEGVPKLLSMFADKVIQQAYKVTDTDVKRLLDLGYTEDAVFETIVSAAAGAGMLRIEQGLTAMKDTHATE
jgi:alkylhydroperoxidase/carboxymuconolactone decarboxylase family protein YurZ